MQRHGLCARCEGCCQHRKHRPCRCNPGLRPTTIWGHYNTPLQMALQPGVGLGLRYNMPPGFSVPRSISPFVYPHLHVIQPSHSWSSSSSCCIQLSVQHLFWDCGVLHSFYMPKPSYSLTFNKPDNVLFLDYGFLFIVLSSSA